MLRTRVVTAAVGLPVILGAILAGDPFFTIVVALALGVGSIEFCHAAGLPVRDPMTWVGAAGAAALPATWHLGVAERDAVLVALAFAVLAIAIARGTPAIDAAHWLTVAGAVVYVGWLGQYFVGVHELPEGRDWLLLAMAATFAGDTAAYGTGLTFGRHKMAPSISPKKTWEGFAGGFVAAVGATVAVYAAGAMEFEAGRAIALGVIIAVVGSLGDLGESLLKRGMGVKDASGLVPGHGGFLDRLDSLLFTVPATYFFVVWAV